MEAVQKNGLISYEFDDFFPKGIVHGFFTRKGGVSPPPWASLNLGGTVGDSRNHVIENRKRIFENIGLKIDSIFDVWQVHSADVIQAENPRLLSEPHQKADAILTDRPGITLFMRFADCVPIMLFDPIRKVIGMVHAGWKGTIRNIVGVSVTAMIEKYGCNPADIRAGIGPSICPNHYEVGPNVVEAAQVVFQKESRLVLQKRNGSEFFDLWAANRILLDQVGVKLIRVGGLCTACDTDHWYSHRAEQGRTGRFGALITLQEPE